MQHEDVSDLKVLITAEEAWPEFEKVVLGARKEILAGFRIFDFRTKLRSAEAREIGDDWFDLICHVLAKGVSFHLVMSDFDPVMATHLHELTWITKRQGAALVEASGAKPEQLSVDAHLHPAQAGALPWIAFLPIVMKRKIEQLGKLSRDRRRRQAVRIGRDPLPEMNTVSHHQKVAVIDGEWLYIGGLDLNERRFDSKDHDRAARETWSDLQLLLRGKAATEAHTHLKEFRAVTSGEKEPTPMSVIRRTASAPRRIQFPFLSPRTVLSEIERAHLDGFKNARELIFIETQYFRSSRIADGIAEAATANTDLRLVLILPGLPDEIAFCGSDSLDSQFGMQLQKTALATVRQAMDDRATFATPVQPRLAARSTKETLSGSPLIHVHNKSLVIDDRMALVGSANLNGRSMHWDTEAAIILKNAKDVDQLRRRMLQHWWFQPLPEEAMSHSTLHTWWHKQIAENSVILPENRSGFLVLHELDAKYRMGQPLPGVTEDIV